MSLQPVGPEVPSPSEPAITPSRVSLDGRYTSLKLLSPSHAETLFKDLGGEENLDQWTYMFAPGFSGRAEWDTAVKSWSESKDPLYFTVFSGPASDPTSEPVGLISYLNIVPAHRKIEIGSVNFGARLKRTRAATEAFYLTIKHAFEDLGNHRVEWKANHLNKPSLSAAERLGFVFEGVFRKHLIIKGRHRDTAWFSITDDEWPVVKKGFEAWLEESNFDENGKQIRGLGECRENSKEAS